MNDRFNIRYFNKNTKKFEYLKIGAVNFNLFTDWTVYEQGQFCTGKKDKNGTLIYEGDIVRLKAKNGMNFDYAVKYKNYCFILEYINGKLKGTKARDFAKQYAQPQRMYEHGYMVIGNIYENKELLESEG